MNMEINRILQTWGFYYRRLNYCPVMYPLDRAPNTSSIAALTFSASNGFDDQAIHSFLDCPDGCSRALHRSERRFQGS
jgi:hypothetical protein